MATRTMSKAELAAEVGRLWGEVAVQAKRATRPLLESQGVTMPQAMALHTLQTAGGRASARDLGYVVISTGVNAPVSRQFADDGWSVKPLGTYWQLAVAPAGRRVTVLTTC